MRKKETEHKEAIRIVPLIEGFVVQFEDGPGYEDDGRAFTDVFDLAEWLLDWLGFDDDRVMISQELLESLWGDDELVDDGAEQQRAEYNAWVEDALEVVEAARAYVESAAHVRPGEYRKLVEAVEKWQVVDEADLSFWGVAGPGSFSIFPYPRGADGAIGELMERNRANRLDVLEAAQEYVDVREHARHQCGRGEREYDKLFSAVNKWQGIEGG